MLVLPAEVLSGDLYCLDVLGVAFLFLIWLYSTVSVIYSCLFFSYLTVFGSLLNCCQAQRLCSAAPLSDLPATTFERRG